MKRVQGLLINLDNHEGSTGAPYKPRLVGREFWDSVLIFNCQQITKINQKKETKLLSFPIFFLP